ncbi:HAD family hydrolase [Leptolyngbya cf. ectocarpi LEGE 11479]|uniref:HAD family hydrolase n=1 Tax=Leptolyngbya cf. ectocarpi LEGE 11479 TaxID=1828722 RepID=A0A928WXD6_LEPEC|nr:HAD family hydrolase [Leptolyngbya ectocarpi]MBE9065107.1 HAD family hydrolase [Leptolyngbya cf. ectocarpi LEGE 11479]
MEKKSVVTLACNGQIFKDIHAVFLDKDGTLADVATYLSQLGHIQAQLMEQALSGTHELTLQALGFNADGLTASGLLAVGSRQETIMGIATVAALVGCPWVKAIDLAIATLKAADQQCSPKALYTPLLPGALDFLQRLRLAGLKIIMVSADSQHNLESFVQHHHLQTYFDVLQGVTRENPTKMSADFLSTACQAIDIEPAQGVVIGDAASDLHMALPTRGFIGYLGGWRPPLSKTDILGDGCSRASLVHSFTTDFSQIVLT